MMQKLTILLHSHKVAKQQLKTLNYYTDIATEKKAIQLIMKVPRRKPNIQNKSQLSEPQAGFVDGQQKRGTGG